MSSEANDPVARARALAPLVREAADEADRERRLPERVAVAMAESGLYRVAVPEQYGGLECDPRTQIETIEAVSEADGAAGWNLMIGVENMGFLGPALPPETAEKVFADPLLIVAGALNPLGRATPVEGGYRVSGQWPSPAAATTRTGSGDSASCSTATRQRPVRAAARSFARH